MLPETTVARDIDHSLPEISNFGAENSSADSESFVSVSSGMGRLSELDDELPE